MSALPEEFAERMARVVKLVRTQRTLPAQLEAVVALAKRPSPPATPPASPSFPLVAGGRTMGALNLYSRRPQAFDDDTAQVVALSRPKAFDLLRDRALSDGLSLPEAARRVLAAHGVAGGDPSKR